MQKGFESEIHDFITHIDSLESSFRLVFPFTHLLGKNYTKKFQSFVENNGVKGEDGTFTFEDKYTRQVKQLEKKYKRTNTARNLIPKSYVTSLISLYDAYIGKLIKVMLYNKPEMLNGSDKTFSYSTLSIFESLDQVREHIMEKEVETVLRKSHAEHFEWLEKKLSIPLKKGLDIWPTFIELTERRNLFVHNDGIVSSQYLHVCKNHKVNFDKEPKVGSSLKAGPKYFEQGYECIFEIGVKLGQVMWRKLCPDETEEADSQLISLSLDLIAEEKYKLAIELLKFIPNIPRVSQLSGEMKYMFKINLAQAYKWDGQEDECLKILDTEDFSALAYKFKLADAVLREDFPTAAEFMKRVDHEEMPKGVWMDWPLFQQFVETDEFKSTYYEKYGEEFISEDIKVVDMENIDPEREAELAEEALLK